MAGSVIWFCSLIHHYIPLLYLIMQKDYFLSFFFFFFIKATLFLFKKQYLRKHTSTIENIGTSEFYRTVCSFFCSSVSYVDTIYSDKLKNRYQAFQNTAAK